jgi:4-hydroxythreonine-4-phosphate dehydrogenase
LQKHPVIGITLGDPGGIGPEVILKAFRRKFSGGSFVLFGSERVLEHHARILSIPFSRRQFEIVDIDNVPKPFFGSRPNISGKASMEYLETAFRYYDEGKIHGIVTGPIQKESWHKSGYRYAGQTEFCADRTRTADYCMLIAGVRLRIAVLSTHLSLADALLHVNQDSIYKKIRLLDREFKRLGISSPEIACAALNPHAGENGAFGTEESTEIQPALEQLRKEGVLVEGPIAPEVIFRIAVSSKKWDVILAMYHDQAMIPIKLLEFEQSANVTLGLPLLRTSPDHGTAFDIAGKGKANPSSMIYAMKLVIKWTKAISKTKNKR